MATFGSADESVQVLISSKGDTKGIKDTNAALEDLTGVTNKSETSFWKLSTAVAAGQAAFQIASKAIGSLKGSLGDAADFEQSRIAFEVMLGSVDKAKTMLTDITNFAKATPFTLPEVVKGTKQLLAYGIGSEQVLNDMKTLGDITAGVGKEKLPFLTLAFGQVATKGHLAGQEIRQFTEAGVPLVQTLADTFGKTTAEITSMSENGEISFDMVRKALEKLSGPGGRFNNLMQRQSHTAAGLFSNFQDGFGIIARSAIGITSTGDIIQGSLLARLEQLGEIALPAVQRAANNVGPVMTTVIDNINEFGRSALIVAGKIGDYLGPKLEALWHTVRDDLAPALGDFWHNIVEPLIPVLGTVLVVALGLVIDAVKVLFEIISPLIQFMADHVGVVQALATVFGILAAAMAFNAIFDALAVGFATLTLVTIPSLMATFGTLITLITGPIVMPAIIVAAAIASINSVKQAWDDVYNSIASVKSASLSDDDVIRNLQNLKKTGTAEQKARATTQLNKLASTGAFADGGYTGQGGANDIAGIVHKGEYVIPKSQVDQNSGKPKDMGGTHIYNFNTGDAVRAFFQLQNLNSQLISKGGSEMRV